MTDREELLDIAEAAAFLNVSETSLRRWTNSGTLRHLRVGRRRERRFRREDLLAFMEHSTERVGSVAAPPPADARQYVIIDGTMVPLGAHQCALYSSDSGRSHLAARFFAGGLRSGSACFLVASRKIRDGVLTELSAVDGALERHIEAGTLVVADYAKSASRQMDFWEEQLRAAQQRGARSMRIVGDVSDFAGRLERSVAEYEDDYSLRIAAVFPVVTLCLYDVRKFSGREIFRVLKSHPHSTREPMERWLA